MGIAGLGAFAGGLTQGLQVGEQMADRAQMRRLREADQGFQDEQRARARKRWGKEDTADEIDKQFGLKVEEFSQQPGLGAAERPSALGSTPTQPPQGAALGPTDAAPPQGAPLGLADVAQPKLRPTEDGIYRAMRWRTDALATAGLFDKFKTSLVDTEKTGTQLRQKALAPALAKLEAGDPSAVVDLYNRYINDGNVLEVSPKGTGPNGPMFSLRQRNVDTGAVRTMDVDQQQFLRMAQQLQDPAAALKSSLDRYHEIFKTNEGIRKEKAQQEAMGKREIEVGQAKHGQTLAEISARTAGEKSVIDHRNRADANVSPKDQLAAIDQQRKQLRDSQLALLKEWELMGKDVTDDQQREQLKAAYLEQKRKIDDADVELGRQRDRVSQRLRLRDAPEPRPGAIPKLPSGAKQIGTSGGRPVFQTPDGKRYIAE